MLSTLFLAAAIAGGPPIYGIAIAGDGDSLTVSGERIRLFGIDAPEFDQTCTRAGAQWACGQEAATQLAKLVTGKEVSCKSTGQDAYGRTVARCTAGTIDVNREMVLQGYAVAFRKYSVEYVSAEDIARINRRGMWSGTFAQPSEVRATKGGRSTLPRQQLRPVTRKSNYAGACVIKGNRSRRGEWIYHLPGMPYYEQTRPEELFCTEAQARAAGYRRANVR